MFQKEERRKTTSEKFRLLLAAGLVLLLAPIAAAQCVQPPAGLVSWWPGDGDANDTIGSNSGTLQNGATFGPGKVGQAFSFDGGSWVTVAPHPTLNLAEELAIEFWFKRTALSFTPNAVGLFGKRADINGLANYLVNVNELGIGISYDDPSVLGGIDFDFFSSPFEAIRIRSWLESQPYRVPDVGQYGHFAGTFKQIDPSRVEARMYINGNEVHSSVLPGNLAHTFVSSPVIIGGDIVTPDNSELFAGMLDEVTLYNRALSAPEIQAIFAAGSAGKCKGLPFNAFNADVGFRLEPKRTQQTFKLNARFITNGDSNGIDPVNEAVSFQIGTFTATLPAGSFRSSGGSFWFKGVINGVSLQVKITHVKGNWFDFMAKGSRADLSGTTIPVTVGINIGDDSGKVTLKNALVLAGSHPITLAGTD